MKKKEKKKNTDNKLTWHVDGGKRHVCVALALCDLDPGVLSEDLDPFARGDELGAVLNLADGQLANDGLDALEEPAVADEQLIRLLQLLLVLLLLLLLAAHVVRVRGIHGDAGRARGRQ